MVETISRDKGINEHPAKRTNQAVMVLLFFFLFGRGGRELRDFIEEIDDINASNG